MRDERPSFADIAVTISLLLTGAVGLFMSLCGGWATSLSFNYGSLSLLSMSVPSMVVGLVTIVSVCRTWVGRRRKRQRLASEQR